MASRNVLRRLATFHSHSSGGSGRLITAKERDQQWVTTEEGPVRLRRSRSLGGVEQESWHMLPVSALDSARLDPAAEAKLNKKRAYNRKSVLLGRAAPRLPAEPEITPEFEDFLRAKRDELRRKRAPLAPTSAPPTLNESVRPRPPAGKRPERAVRIAGDSSAPPTMTAAADVPQVVVEATLSSSGEGLRASTSAGRALDTPPSPRRSSGGANSMEARVALLTREGIEIAMVDGAPVIRAGRLERVVHRCAVYLSSSVELQTVQNQIVALFIALPRFCNPVEMVALIEKVYQEPVVVPAGASAETQSKFTCRYKLGVLRLFVMWMEYDAQAVATDKAFHHRAITFLAALGADFPPKERDEVVRLRDAARDHFSQARKRAETSKVPLPPAKPIGLLTRRLALGSFEFGDLHPRDVADTLTVLDKRALASITRREILTQKWEGVQEAFTRAGKVAKWVATEVVYAEPLSRRVEVLARWIDVCERLYFNRNFHSLLTVLSGLNHVSVLRLARTWAKLSQTQRKRSEELTQVMAQYSNFKTYRNKLKRRIEKGRPAVPSFEVVAKDLIFFNENPDKIAGFLNFDKFIWMANYCLQIEKLQALAPAPDAAEDTVNDRVIQQFLDNPAPVVHKEDELYKQSLKAEPRTKELA